MAKSNISSKSKHVVGQTRSVGFQIGVRRTLPIALEEAWQLLMSTEGVRLWLGHVPRVKLEKGATYSLKDGVKGEVRVFDPHRHLRITWQPKGWARPSTIQIRVIPNGLKTTIAFHQEHLPNAAAREERRGHFEAALEAIERLVVT